MNVNRLNKTIPSVTSFLDPREPVLDLIGGRELLVLHEATQAHPGDDSLRGEYVTGVIHLPQPPERVGEQLTDFRSHERIVELYDSVSVREDRDDGYRVHYEANVEMALLTLSVQYTLNYTRRSESEWLWFCDDGDLDTYRGRVEILPVNDDESLLCLTSRTDFSGVSWLLDSVLWAQPDLNVTLPVTMTAIQLHGFHGEMKQDPLGAAPSSDASEPSPPGTHDLPVDSPEVKQLAERGTLLLFHPRQTVPTSDGPVDLLFTTGMRILEGPVERARKKLSDFKTYPEFIDQVNRVTQHRENDNIRTEWFFRLGLGVLSIPISFTIDYRWNSEGRLVFEQSEGHFDLISGCLEWYETGPNQTLYCITSGSYIDEDAPRLVRLANTIPYREVFMGITLSTVILQKSKRWFEQSH